MKRLVKYIIFRHLFCLLIFVFIAPVIHGQNPKSQPVARKKILLQNADVDSILTDPVSGKDIHYLKGNVKLLDNETRMSCDSAHFSPSSNQVTAFNKVHIQQGDTLNLFGDYLFYDGKLSTAFVKGNVELIDKETHLYTDSIHYDVKNRIAKYTEWGKIKNADNTLTSIIGVYYASEKLFHFKDSVKIVNPKYVMTADTMDYNSLSEIAYFTGPTFLKGDSINLYCERGWYDTKKEITSVWKNAMIDNRHQIMHGDSLYFNNNTGFGESFRNVIIQDTVNDLAIEGNYAWVYKEPERFLVTDKAVFIQISDQDSLFLHADTINSVSIPIKIENKTLETVKDVATNSLTNKTDTIKNITDKRDTITVSNKSESSEGVSNRTETKNTSTKSGKLKAVNIKALTRKPDTIKPLIEKINTRSLSYKTGISKPATNKLVAKIISVKSNTIKPFTGKVNTGTVSNKTDTLKAKANKVVSEIAPGKPDTTKALADKINPNPVSGNKSSVEAVTNKTDTVKTLTVIKKPATSYRLMRAFHNVRIYSKELQAKCDSLSYSFRDSVIRLYKAPVIWTQDNQLTADSMALFTKNRQSDRLELYNNAFIAIIVDTIRFNQIKGRTLTGYFKNNEAYKIDIRGNGESVYYLLDGEDVAGKNKSKCANIEVLLDKGKVSEIYEYENPDGVIDPPLPATPERLEGFKWLDIIRPKKKADIFIKTK